MLTAGEQDILNRRQEAHPFPHGFMGIRAEPFWLRTDSGNGAADRDRFQLGHTIGPSRIQA